MADNRKARSGQRSDSELNEELMFHIEARARDLERTGLSAEEARRQARIEFGGLENYKEAARAQHPGHALDALMQDLRFAFRLLKRSPGFTLVAIATLALGIGGNTAIFTVVNSALLKPLPFHDPAQLVMIQERLPKIGPGLANIPAPDVLDVQRLNRSFESVAGYYPHDVELSGAGQPKRLNAPRVGAELMPLLGISPQIGRTFSKQEEDANAAVVLLSDSLWRQQFAADPSVLGRTVNLDRKPYTVIGVMPRSFDFPLGMTGSASKPSDIWIPLSLTKQEREAIGDNFDYRCIARLKAGVTPQQVDADLQQMGIAIHAKYPPEAADFVAILTAVPLRENAVGSVRTLLFVLLGAVGCVLLIACVNIASLLLARSASRRREIAVRLALGASARRLVSQLLAESLLLSLLGAGVGFGLASGGTQLLLKLLPTGLTLLHSTTIDIPVLMFTIVLAVITGTLFGLAPAYAALRTDVNEALKESARGSHGLESRRLRSGLVVAEVALAMVLLAGAGLLLRSFEHVRHTDPGFAPEHVITAGVQLPRQQYVKRTDVRNFYLALEDRLAQLPGVKSAGLSTDLPLEYSWGRLFTVEDYVPAPGEGFNNCAHSVVLGNYFKAMGIPLVRGRVFTQQDDGTSQLAVIVSESLAKRYWPNQDPIGKRIHWGIPTAKDPWEVVVGVVGDVKSGALDEQTLNHTYEPYLQVTRPGEQGSSISDQNIALRVEGDPTQMVGAMRQAVAGMDRQLPLSDVRTMDQVIDESTESRRATLWLLAMFAVSALLLAAVGLYGVIAQGVTQRTREIGIRMALGARRSDILAMVLRSGMLLVGVGVAIGVVAGLALTRLMVTLLFEVKPGDPVTFLGVGVMLALVALVASYLPARRATRVEPLEALRYE